jgi:hypothetical protein
MTVVYYEETEKGTNKGKIKKEPTTVSYAVFLDIKFNTLELTIYECYPTAQPNN